MCTDQECEKRVCLHLSIDNHRFSRYLIKAMGFLFILFVLSGMQKPQQIPLQIPVDICTFPHKAEGFALLSTRPRESSAYQGKYF